jgi:hypothetical protein
LSLVSVNTGLVLPARCARLSCGACIPNRAVRAAFAVALARPELFLTLTLVGDDWTTVHRRLRRWRQDLCRSHRFEQVAFIQPNPGGTGTHAHLLTWGSSLTETAVAVAAERAGMGSRVEVSRVRDVHAVSRYGLHPLLKAPAPDNSPHAESLAYLDANGGRLLHASRRFWRDEQGHQIVGGLRAASSAAMAASGLGPWRLVN